MCDASFLSGRCSHRGEEVQLYQWRRMNQREVGGEGDAAKDSSTHASFPRGVDPHSRDRQD